MKILVSVARNLFAVFAGSLATLAAFGLLLALAWLPAGSDDVLYKLAALLLVTALAFLLGGYVAARAAGREQEHAGLLFGLFLGLIAFAYVLGAHWSLLLAVPLTAALGATGAHLARSPNQPTN